MSAPERPIAVYTDAEDIDIVAGAALLDAAGFDVRELGTVDPDAIVAGAADATALLAGYAHITANMMDALPRLRIIALISMGTDMVDVSAATARGIWVTNLPDVATEEVATHALAMLLSLIRNLPFHDASVRGGRWYAAAPVTPPRLSESTLGIVGLGHIGRKLAELARPLFGRVVGFDPVVGADSWIERATLPDLKASADVISLHVPLTIDTENLVDDAFLAAMRPGGYLVNVSRGRLVDVASVCRALDSRQLSGFAADVFDGEPVGADNALFRATGPLVSSRNVVASPHIAYLSRFTAHEYVRLQAQNVIDWSRTGAPSTPVNTPVAHPAR